MILPILVAIIAAVLVGAVLRAVVRHGRGAQPRPHAAAEPGAWRQAFEASNPAGPPVTREEIEEIKAWHASLALPAVELLPAPERPVTAAGTRIGGPVWLPDGEAWPADADGEPLEFVAQVDFAELPPLPDFPAAGLLQFFVGRDDLYGAEFDDPGSGAARVLWRPDGPSGGRLHPPPTHAEGVSPWQRADVRAAGLSLAGQPAEHLPAASDWRLDARLEGLLRRPGLKEIEEMRHAGDDARPLRHHMGGHPAFTQYDFREPGRGDDYDRTLLRLTSDGNLLWGDCGEANFLVRRGDLLRRDFSSAVFYWDCT